MVLALSIVILGIASGCLAVPSPGPAAAKASRIVDGMEAAPGEFPHQVDLRYKDRHQCGASVLNEVWVLTAAHCVIPTRPELFKILSGTQDLEHGGTVHDIDVIINHELHDPVPSYNDICVIRVLTPFLIDGVTIKPINLPLQDQGTPAGSPATVIGWGFNSTDQNYLPSILRKVDIQVDDQNHCAKVYLEYNKCIIIDSMICGDTPEGGKGFCTGDSGGPLLVDGEVVGLVSYAKQGCSYVGYPGVYTRVASFRSWILQKTGV